MRELARVKDLARVKELGSCSYRRKFQYSSDMSAKGFDFLDVSIT
jgi:hypothetical protein